MNDNITITGMQQVSLRALAVQDALRLSILANNPTAQTFETRIHLFQRSLFLRTHALHNLYKVERLHRIMRSFHSLQLKGEKEIETICKNNWTSYSSARRDFLQYVGFTPKYSQQIIRFKHALKAYKKEGYQFYCEDYGYTDFSHFAKDARLITGRPPSDLI